MSLTRVVVTPEVFLTCTTHALTTEAEEIMGLLLGDIRGDEGSQVAYIRRAVPQIRTDRRKDRVETSPQQMASCSALAEHISSSTGVPTRVVGWYHSHPHITVLPSHVDVNTQAMYQLLDPCFVGLIFSVFNSSANKDQTVQVTAFQSVPSNSPWGQLQAVSSGDLELEGLDSQIQLAMKVSAAEHMQDLQAGGSSWQRKEVPLCVMQEASNPSTLTDYVEVQKMLLAEEQEAHQQRTNCSSSSSTASSNDLHAALLQIHHSAVYQQALLQHAECVLAPALAAMQALSLQADIQAQQLAAENQRLQKLLEQRQAAQATAAAAEDSPMEPPSTPLINMGDGLAAAAVASIATAIAPTGSTAATAPADDRSPLQQ